MTRRRFTVHDYHRMGEAGSSYRNTERARRGQALAPLTLPEITFRVVDLLG